MSLPPADPPGRPVAPTPDAPAGRTGAQPADRAEPTNPADSTRTSVIPAFGEGMTQPIRPARRPAVPPAQPPADRPSAPPRQHRPLLPPPVATPPPQPPPATPVVEPPTEPVKLLAGRYRLERLLGKGAMGQVWAAHDINLNRWVAIKEVTFPRGTPAAEADQVAQRAMREARAIASMSDPHVVTVFDLLMVGQSPAIVMELLDARSLADVLKAGPIGDAEAAVVGLGVASGLLAAHAAGVTHRDVKPGNVLLCRDGRVKLTDFGIARSIGENTLTATGILLGSPAYISPEVASGEAATTRSDAWGLGALLYACVQGTPPFDAGTPLKTLAAVVQQPAPAVTRGGRLTELITGLLVKDPARRTTVAAAHAELVRLAGDPRGHRLVTHVWAPGGPPGPRTRMGSRTSPDLPPRPAGSQRRPDRPFSPPPDLPPPPWAGQATGALRALPAQATPEPAHRRWTWMAAVVVAVAAAAAGFFGVRAIAQLGSTTQQSAPATISSATAADPAPQG